MRHLNPGPVVRAAIGALLLLPLAAPVSAEHHVKLHWSGELGLGYDDNVGNAANDDDVRDSGVVSGGLSLDYTRSLSLNTAFLLRGALQGEAYEAENRLSSGRALALTRLSHRASGGFYVPTFAVWLSAGALEFDSAMRDGFEYRGGVYMIEPLTTAISARLGVSAHERSADNAVFDMSGWSAALNLDWAALPRLTVYAGYQFLDGDVVSSGTVPPKSSHLASGCGSASACDADDALDDQFAYRIDARTHVGSVGLNVPLSRRLALDAQGRYVDSTADGGTSYERVQGVISLLLRL